jgi:hypothetical protein
MKLEEWKQLKTNEEVGVTAEENTIQQRIA